MELERPGGAGVAATLRGDERCLIRILRIRHILGRRRRGLAGRLRRRGGSRLAGGRCGARRRRTLADRLMIAGSDHHHDELRLFGRDDLARGLRPVHVAFGIVADQARAGAMLAHDADLGPFRERVLEPVGEPIGHRIAHDHDGGGDRRIGFARLRRWGMGIVRRRGRGARNILRAEEAAERIVLLLLLELRLLLNRSRWPPRRTEWRPELRLRGHQQRDRQTGSRNHLGRAQQHGANAPPPCFVLHTHDPAARSPLRCANANNADSRIKIAVKGPYRNGPAQRRHAHLHPAIV